MKRMLLSIAVVGLLGVGAYNLIQPRHPQVVLAQEVSSIDENAAFLQDEQNTISIVETYGPSVVAINVTARGENVTAMDNIPEEFRDLLPPGFQVPEGQDGEAPLQEGAGSGFIVDERGHIVTNYHVVQQALIENSNELAEGSEITVTFSGSTNEIPVNILGINALYDLAMLQLVNPDDLPETAKAIPIANSDELKVGQKVVAIGNPFGLESTVTAGIVSAVNRIYVPSIGGLRVPMVQTDAAINPGNSGGPLLNSRGELIGVNTAIVPSMSITGERGNLGIGFAMPSNVLKNSLADLQEGTFVGGITSRPRIGIGISSVSDVYTDSQIAEFNLPKKGVVVTRVEPNGPGDKAKLRVALDSNNQLLPDATDIILEVDSTPVSTPEDLQNIVLSKGAGDKVVLKVWRDGEVRDVEVTLEVVEQN
jgi:S1-C subfamily serine protease